MMEYNYEQMCSLAESREAALEFDRKVLAWQLYDAKIVARHARQNLHYSHPLKTWGRSSFDEAFPVEPSFPRPTGARVEYEKMTEEQLKVLNESQADAEKRRKRAVAESASEDAGVVMENAQDELDRLTVLLRTAYFLVVIGTAALVAIWPLSWLSWLPMVLAILVAAAGLSGGVTLIWKHWSAQRRARRVLDRASRAYTKTTLNTDLYL